MMNDQKTNNTLSLEEIMSDRFGRYSKYIIQDRALPNINDGLKPVQRRILYAMYQLRLFHNTPFKKSARIVGEVIGKYHPHGDQSIYEALVRMSQEWKMNIPLVEMHGNKGSMDNDPAAAMRYTEVRLNKIAETMLYKINDGSTQFLPNFDNTESEPVVLPALFPNLLVNGARGIAAGYATEMPPHNLKEIINGVITKIKQPNCRFSTLTKIIKGPDFPTGGVIVGSNGIIQAFERGFARIIIRSKCVLDETKTHPSITITEIPYGVIKSKLVKEIDNLRFLNKIYGIKEVRDESDRQGVKIVINLVRGAKAKIILNYLFKKTQMQIYYSYNNVVIERKKPVLLNLNQLIEDYVQHVKNFLQKHFKHELLKNLKKLEVVQGIIKAIKIINVLIETIKNTKGNKEQVVKNLMVNHNFSNVQGLAIAEMPLYRLSNLNTKTLFEDEKKLTDSISHLETLTTDKKTLDQHIIHLLKNSFKNFFVERKTKISVQDENAVKINKKDLVKSETIYLCVSKNGYVKKIKKNVYFKNVFSTYGLKTNDLLVAVQQVNSLDNVLFFTNKGRCLNVPVYQLSENTKWKNLGINIGEISLMGGVEKIVSIISVGDFNSNAYINQVSKGGRIKRSRVVEFQTLRNSKFTPCFTLKSDDALVSVYESWGNNEIVIWTSDGKYVKYPETLIKSVKLKAKGKKAILLQKNFVVGSCAINDKLKIGVVNTWGKIYKVNATSLSVTPASYYGRQYFEKPTKSNDFLKIGIIEKSTLITLDDAKSNKIRYLKVFEVLGRCSSINILKKKESINKCSFLNLNVKNLFFALKTQKSGDEEFKKAEEQIRKVAQLKLLS